MITRSSASALASEPGTAFSQSVAARSASTTRHPISSPFELDARTLFSVLLALSLFVGSDALFPLWASGGDEMDLDSDAAAKARTLEWLAVYPLAGLGFVLSWRAVLTASRAHAMFMAVLALALVSAAWSDEPARAAYSAVQLIVFTLLALTISERVPLERAVTIAAVTFLGLVVLSVAVVVVRPDLGISNSVMYDGAWRGAFIHKNHFGIQLTFAFVTFFAIFILGRPCTRWPCLIILTGIVYLCYKARSSTALLFCIFVPLMYAALVIGRLSRTALFGLIGVTSGGLALAAAMLAFGWEELMIAIGKDPTISGRSDLWALIYRGILIRPLLGFGYDSYWLSHSTGGGYAITQSVVWAPGGAHNGWIEVVTQLGIAGLVAWIVVYLRTAMLALRVITTSALTRNPNYPWLVMLFAAVTAWSFVESHIMRHGNSAHFVFVLCTGYLLRPSQEVRDGTLFSAARR